MRLLYKTQTGGLALKEVIDPSTTSYAILSHRWFDEGEILYDDLVAQGSISQCAEQHTGEPREHGWAKIHGALQQAALDGYQYIWIDTCCIDKRSSAELSESINSMYRWYELASICYAYLWDVHGDGEELTDQSARNRSLRFTQSQWFTRGWTLQELLAPKSVRFFSTDWKYIGSSETLVRTLSSITGIHHSALSGQRSLASFSAAQRMSWAAFRKTTRVEDEAYCLLGLFEVNMPLIYGEGNKAFIRLQEEILRTTTDLSILAWNENENEHTNYWSGGSPLLSESPSAFVDCRDFWPTFGDYSLRLGNLGLEASLPLVKADETGDLWYAMLNCELSNRFSRVIALTILRLHLSQYNENPLYLVVRREHSCHPFGEGRNRLSVIDSITWAISKISTVNLLRQPQYANFRDSSDDSDNFTMHIIRRDNTATPILITDIYPRESGTRRPGASKFWREPSFLIHHQPIKIQRGRGTKNAIEFDMGGQRLCIVIAIDQNGQALRTSLPEFCGAVEVVLPHGKSLKQCCEGLTSTSSQTAAKSSCHLGGLSLCVELTGASDSDTPVMTLHLSAGAPDQQQSSHGLVEQDPFLSDEMLA